MPHATPRIDTRDIPPAPPPRRGLRRLWPVLVLAALVVLAYAFGLDHQLSLAAVVRNSDALHAFVAAHWLLAVCCYALLYVAMTVASLPVAAVMSIAGGFLFGWKVSVPLSVLSATVGATIVYHIVSTTVGRSLAERAGPFVTRFRQGFARDAFYYLLSLRLLPVFPFFMVNAVAGLARVNIWAFIAATVLGIVPGALAYAWLGAGLDNFFIMQRKAYEICNASHESEVCQFHIDPDFALSPQMIAAFFGLAVLALVPLGLRYLRRRPLA